MGCVNSWLRPPHHGFENSMMRFGNNVQKNLYVIKIVLHCAINSVWNKLSKHLSFRALGRCAG